MWRMQRNDAGIRMIICRLKGILETSGRILGYAVAFRVFPWTFQVGAKIVPPN
jgi:hypothetical protein